MGLLSLAVEQFFASTQLGVKAGWRLNVSGQQENANERKVCPAVELPPLKPKDGLSGPPVPDGQGWLQATNACCLPPTLRKKREGWGTHCWVTPARIKTSNEVWRTDLLAFGSEGCHCLVVTFVGLEDRVESGAVKQFSYSLIGAN